MARTSFTCHPPISILKLSWNQTHVLIYQLLVNKDLNEPYSNNLTVRFHLHYANMISTDQVLDLQYTVSDSILNIRELRNYGDSLTLNNAMTWKVSRRIRVLFKPRGLCHNVLNGISARSPQASLTAMEYVFL